MIGTAYFINYATNLTSVKGNQLSTKECRNPSTQVLSSTPISLEALPLLEELWVDRLCLRINYSGGNTNCKPAWSHRGMRRTGRSKNQRCLCRICFPLPGDVLAQLLRVEHLEEQAQLLSGRRPNEEWGPFCSQLLLFSWRSGLYWWHMIMFLLLGVLEERVWEGEETPTLEGTLGS